MIRFFDICFSIIGLILFSPIMSLIFIIGYCKNIKPIFKQQRVGYKKKIFIIYKFRTMEIGTKFVATHLHKNINLSFYNFFLRKSKLDELPQLFNVLKGDMCLVGFRPCLSSQKKLINLRNKYGVFNTKPGITGLAQLLGITMKYPRLVAKLDKKMINVINLFNYFYYIFKTILIILRWKH